MSTDDVDPRLRSLIESPHNPCFVCSLTNPRGLHLHFELRDGIVRSTFVPQKWHEGWAHVVHGGILSAVLDEAMAYTLFFRGVKAVTAKMDVRFRAEVRSGDVLEVEADVTRDARSLVDVESRLIRNGTNVVEAKGRFAKLGELDLNASLWQ